MPFVLRCLTLFAVALPWPGSAWAQSPDFLGLQWSQLDPADDWTAQLLRGVFPALDGGGDAGEVQNQRTVLGLLVGLFSGFVCLIAVVWVVYATILEIVRAGDTGRLIDERTSFVAPVRMAFAAVMMLPVPGSGTSVGQALVMQGAMGGIGAARLLWSEAVRAIGPDAVPIAEPMIPGTKAVVAGLLQNELCRALVNAAANNPAMAPAPAPVAGGGGSVGAYVAWHYSLAVGNASGAPVCGTVAVRQPGGETVLHGVDIDMTARQQEILQDVVEGVLRPAAEAAGAGLWSTREASALAPLQGAYVSGVARYTDGLTAAATEITAALRAAVTAEAVRAGTPARNGLRLSSLGWSGAGAYSLELGRLNGATLAVLASTPVVTPPNYQNLGPHLSADLRPMLHAVASWRDVVTTHAQTTDGTDVPGGYADLFTGASPGDEGAGVLERVARAMRLNERVLNAFVQMASPAQSMWRDPFAAQVQLGHKLVMAALTALGVAALLASTPATAAVMAANVLTLNFTGAAAAATGYMAVQFLGAPIFWLLMSFLIPGLVLAYVLPMLPFFFWFAGVLGWIILVLELLVAVPLWMFAHMTWRGEGLHGRGFHGYAMLLNMLFRPALMLIGLFAGYVVYAAAAWFLQMTFGVAAGFVLMNGWLVTNLIGVGLLMCMFVLAHIVATTQSFRLISIVPHHVVRLAGLEPANRVDMDAVAQQMGPLGMVAALGTVNAAMASALPAAQAIGERRAAAALAAPDGSAAPMDRTVAAASDVVGPPPGRNGGLDGDHGGRQT